jgi:hypothetical protein
MKWARLMFGREFHIDDVSLLWDALFAMRAAGREPSLAADSWTNAPLPQSIELVAVAMVVREREFLMSRDYSQALKRLMKYPPVENVLSFAARARAMRRMMSEGCPLSEAFRRAIDDPKDRHDGEHAIERHESPSGGATGADRHAIRAAACESDASSKGAAGVTVGDRSRARGWIQGGLKQLKNVAKQAASAAKRSDAFASYTSPFANEDRETSAADGLVSRAAKDAPARHGQSPPRDVSKPFNVKHVASGATSFPSLGPGVLAAKLPSSQAETLAQVNAMAASRMRLGVHMDRLCRALEEEWATRADGTRAQQVVAELGMVRDVLLGRLEERACQWGLSTKTGACAAATRSDEEPCEVSSDAIVFGAKVREFYALHNPSKLDMAATIADQYIDRQDELWAMLRKKYPASSMDASPSAAKFAPALMTAAPVAGGAVEKASPRNGAAAHTGDEM